MKKSHGGLLIGTQREQKRQKKKKTSGDFRRFFGGGVKERPVTQKPFQTHKKGVL